MKKGVTSERLTQLLLLFNSLLLVGLFAWNTYTFLSNPKLQIKTLVYSENALTESRFGSKLAIVIPFTKNDFEVLHTNLKRWKKYEMCLHSRKYSHFIDIVFYYNKDLWVTTGLVSELKKEMEPFTSCFNQIRFLSASLSDQEDKYPRGASNMFFKLFGTQSFVSNYNYMYYMEPDNLPCRNYWLDKVYEEATIDGNFWMKGSIIREAAPIMGTYSFANHINGNSIYRLDSPDFLRFLTKVKDELALNPSKYIDSYDIAIYLIRNNRDLINFQEFTSIQHNFVYDNFIQNYYRTIGNISQICRESPTTYFVHGRNLVE